MRISILLSFYLLPAILFSQDSLINQLNTILDNWHASAARADMQTYFDKIDDEGVYIGTDASEYWTKREFYDWSKPYFDKGKAWTFKAIERHIGLSEDKTIAWFYEKLEASYGELRGSGVMTRKKGTWTIVQYVLSLPVPNDKFNSVLESLKNQ